jgi:hypothetical protein
MISAMPTNLPARISCWSAAATPPRTSARSASSTAHAPSPSAIAPSPWALRGRKGFEERPLLTHVKGARRSSRTAPAATSMPSCCARAICIIFRFLEESLRLKTNNRLYPARALQGCVLAGEPEADLLGHAGSVLHLQHVRCPGLVCARRVVGTHHAAGCRRSPRTSLLARARGGGEQRLRGHRLPGDYMLDLLGEHRLSADERAPNGRACSRSGSTTSKRASSRIGTAHIRRR